MRASRLHLVTYRQDPADAEVVSHRLMARAGYIFKVSAGVYAYTPLLWRTLRKANQIVREELDAAGCLEMQAPILQLRSLWEESDRWAVYVASGTMLRTTDRKGAEFGLAPTAEEVITAYVRATVSSYRQLPITLYQIHTKFRDELRPRFGLLRVKEFLMKDAYSFDVDDEGLDQSYETLRKAYHRIFRRMGLESFGVEADPGDIGGSGSIEFMVAADTGEDAILIEGSSGYAANVEKATSRIPAPYTADPLPMRIELTPDIRTCAELEEFFDGFPRDRMVKTVLYQATYPDREEPWAALIRGDQEVNEVKLRNHTGALALRLLGSAEIRDHTGADQGFAGPVGLPEVFRVVADESVRGMSNLLCGVNRTDHHALDVNIGRDFPEPTYGDIRLARAGEPGPVDGTPLVQRRGIEVGHIFKLGTKYSAAMGATCTNSQGRGVPLVMGCYGIGVSRACAAAVEQNADEHGIVWPVPLAPFEVAIALLSKKEDTVAAAEQLYQQLLEAGVDALLDDRRLSPGAKLKDLELMGFPYLVIVGRTLEREGVVELVTRRGMERETLEPQALSAELVRRLEALRVGLS